MKIRLQNETGRRLAWTDRKDGYIELLFSSKIANNGYYRGNHRFFEGFTINGHLWTEAKYIDFYPYGLNTIINGSPVQMSLLLDEQAIYITSEKNVGFYSLNPKPSNDNSTEEQSKLNKISKLKIDFKKNSIDGISVLSADGIAIAAEFDFYHSFINNTMELYVSDQSYTPISKNSSAEENKSLFQAPGWYMVFEKDEKTAIEKAVRLAKEKGIVAHCKKIDDFMNKGFINTGDEKFDEAIQWARFNGWLLATKDHDSKYRGIWAGLPWFRDNWGRDTFIALNGILLASGCFEEAKDVLLGFAGFQDRDKNSATYGRIPNRYRDEKDVIYNTVDGTLWFIRALYEYIQYSGDTEILKDLSQTIEIAVDADISRCDGNGLLCHGDADTWMDARIMNNQPWSPRGNRANDIQALWYTALKISAIFMKWLGKNDISSRYDKFADKVGKSFENLFWSENAESLADHLPEGGYGEWTKDLRVRPNQLMTISVPAVLPKTETGLFVSILDQYKTRKIMENVNRELVCPFGLYSLSPEDPIFHPEHENPEHYHKDAAYHNGTIWEWNSGPYISSCAITSNGVLPVEAASILKNEAKMIMDLGCAGTLSENIHARPDSNGNPKLSGTFSQAWSVAEFVRNISQDVSGFVPRLFENKIEFRPCLPAACKTWESSMTFGKNWKFNAFTERKSKVYESKITWTLEGGDSRDLPKLTVNGVELIPGKTITVNTPAELTDGQNVSALNKFECPSKWFTAPFPKRDLCPDWNGAERGPKNYLQNVILSGRMQSKTCAGENTAALEWFFDSETFKKKYLTDTDLGALYSPKQTTFRLWAPTAREVSVLLYDQGDASKADAPKQTIQMNCKKGKSFNGIWEISVPGDLHETYYEFRLLIHGVFSKSADPYAHACGVNGKRSMVVDLKRTNPNDWDKVKTPEVKCKNDVIVYEAHIADISSSKYWNGSDKNRRLYSGAYETCTNINGIPTGFDHIKKLGVTHVQLLPLMDFISVDESKMTDKDYCRRIKFGAFNWGYDPQNYGVPEGSYSSDPFNGTVRIKELKSLIQAYAKAGIGIILDVVFNHVRDGLYMSLGTSVPGYFYRIEGYSGAGEDTASEREMFRKFMVDTLSFWLKEYKLSGFRFDLMGLHDTDTMNAISKALKNIRKDVLLYGEGWQMYNAGKMVPATQVNAAKMPDIGHFNDAIRCAIKGSVFNDQEPGFIHNGNRKEALKFGIVGAVEHPDIEYSKVEGTAAATPWTETTWTSVNYTEIHDNITLNDKLHLVEENKPEEYYDQLQKMAISLILLSEGMPILHAGMEFCRTKEIPQQILDTKEEFYDVGWSSDKKHAYLRNTYNITDKINNLDWKRCEEKYDVVTYVQELISLRKQHAAFRLSTGKQVRECLSFIDNKKAGLTEQVLAWQLDGTKCGDSWEKIIIIANPFGSDAKYQLPEAGNKHWSLITDGSHFINDDSNPTYQLDSGSVFNIRPKTVTIFAIK